MTTHTHATSTQYFALQAAFDHFNAALFSGGLPPVLITLRKQANSKGYYLPGKFEARDGAGTVSELCLNPAAFNGRTDKEILSDLVRQMAHHWQHVNGTAPRKAYCDRQWAARMAAMGLNTDNGKGGNAGQSVAHTIQPGGLFDVTASAFLAEHGNAIDWQTMAAASDTPARSSKAKFTCPACGQNAWGAPTIRIACMPCDLPMDAA